MQETIKDLTSIWGELQDTYRGYTTIKEILSPSSSTKIRDLEGELSEKIVEILVRDKEAADFLYGTAREVRNQTIGNKIAIRGVLEVSSACKANCFYCPMRRDNTELARKRMDKEEIEERLAYGYANGIREFFIQSGEDRHIFPPLKEVIKAVKNSLADTRIILNLGDLQKEQYKSLKALGVDGYLIKHEIIDPELHRKYRPHSTLKERVQTMLDAKNAGLTIGTGTIVGMPKQTLEMLAQDVLFAGKIGSDEMVSCSPFIPGQHTPLEESPAGDFRTTLNLIAIYRLLFPHARIPAVSALDSPKLISRPSYLPYSGQSAGILAGANGITINLTPDEMQKRYPIYDGARNTIDFTKAYKIAEETLSPLDIH